MTNEEVQKFGGKYILDPNISTDLIYSLVAQSLIDMGVIKFDCIRLPGQTEVTWSVKAVK